MEITNMIGIFYVLHKKIQYCIIKHNMVIDYNHLTDHVQIHNIDDLYMRIGLIYHAESDMQFGHMTIGQGQMTSGQGHMNICHCIM